MHIILFHDKSKKEISDEQYAKLIQSSVSGVKGIEIGGSFYTFSSIAKIPKKEDFEREYPEEAPEARNVFQELYGDTRDYKPLEQTTKNEQNQARGILKGLKKFIDEEMAKGQKPKWAIEKYTSRLENYKRKFAATANKELQEIAKSFGGELI
jgi:hypothetical protein